MIRIRYLLRGYTAGGRRGGRWRSSGAQAHAHPQAHAHRLAAGLGQIPPFVWVDARFMLSPSPGVMLPDPLGERDATGHFGRRSRDSRGSGRGAKDGERRRGVARGFEARLTGSRTSLDSPDLQIRSGSRTRRRRSHQTEPRGIGSIRPGPNRGTFLEGHRCHARSGRTNPSSSPRRLHTPRLKVSRRRRTSTRACRLRSRTRGAGCRSPRGTWRHHSRSRCRARSPCRPPAWIPQPSAGKPPPSASRSEEARSRWVAPDSCHHWPTAQTRRRDHSGTCRE